MGTRLLLSALQADCWIGAAFGIGFDWVCFFEAERDPIFRNRLQERRLRSFCVKENWLCLA
jgi:hypothetical protein